MNSNLNSTVNSLLKKKIDEKTNKLKSFEILNQNLFKSPNNKKKVHQNLINSSYFNFNKNYNNLKPEYNWTIYKKRVKNNKKKINFDQSTNKSLWMKKLENKNKKPKKKIEPKLSNSNNYLSLKMKYLTKNIKAIEKKNNKKIKKSDGSWEKKFKKKKNDKKKKIIENNRSDIKSKKNKSNYNFQEKPKKRKIFIDKNYFDKKNNSYESEIDEMDNISKDLMNQPTYIKNKMENGSNLNEDELEKQAKDIFLDLIKESPDILLWKQEIKKQFVKNWEENINFSFNSKIEYYEINKIIGKGNFGSVYLGIQKITNRPVAIKIISKCKLKNDEAKKKVDLEVKILKLAFGQNNIIKFYEMFENEKYIFWIFEFCSNGDLLNNLKTDGIFEEDKAKIIIFNILKGMQYLHSLNILHRDIKLENILMDNNNIPKIADFGISMLIKDNEIIVDTAGTPAYLAPEIIKAEGETGFKSDIWSLGVFLYALIFGKVPFKSSNLQDLYKKIIKGKWNLPQKFNISNNLTDLIKRMLNYTVKNRINLKECISHPWFNNKKQNFDNNLINYDNLNDLKKNISILLLNKLGFPKNFIIQSIKSQYFNHASACFYNIYENLDFI